MEKVKVGTVWTTRDYGAFKRLEGNREVSKVRVKRIRASIEENGYIRNPITVNEKAEIIDGQGRLEALRQLGLPVEFVVAEGAGLRECIAMNANMTNWGLLDYISAYADEGNVSYIYLRNLFKAYGKEFNVSVITNAISGTNRGNANNIIKDGDFVCTAEQYDTATRALEYYRRVKDVIDSAGGRSYNYYVALRFCFTHPDVDKERLCKKMHQMQANLIPTIRVDQAFRVIEEIYNSNARKKVYIESDYKKMQDARFGWYAKKWGSR